MAPRAEVAGNELSPKALPVLLESRTKMWPRKQPDIDWADFACGLRFLFSCQVPPSDASVVPADWIPSEEVIVSLSVRSGWDLLLTALRLPAGSQVLVSVVTIPDMVRIIEQHGLVAVPVDIDGDRLEPSLEQIEQSISPRTRAVLVGHLFGSRVNMEPIHRLAKQHNLIVVEDCAQAFVGRCYAGHPESDCSLFSFGPIKTATALGGAVLRVIQPELRNQMIRLQRAYPVQSRRAYLSRLGKYALIRLLLMPRNYGALVQAFRFLGIDYDRVFGNAAHSFGRADFFHQIRRRPCPALVRLLQRKLARFDARGSSRLVRRTARGDQLTAMLPAGMVVGGQNISHTYWVMPIRVANPVELLATLRRAGFDASSRSSLMVVPAPAESRNGQREYAAWLAETIFLPNGDDIPEREWQRIGRIVADVARPAAPCQPPRSALPRPVTVPS